MFKKFISAAMALCLLFGSAAALPENYVFNETSITASADDTKYFNFSLQSDGTYEITNLQRASTDTYPATLTVPSQYNGKNVTKVCLVSLKPNTTTTKIIIPDTVTSLSDSAFEGLQGLTTMTIPSSVKSIGNSLFQGCKKLESVTFEGDLTSLGTNMFNNCTSLKSFSVPNGVKSVGDATFSNCTSLTSVSIPASVTSISLNAFGKITVKNGSITSNTACTALKTINVDSNNANYSSVNGVLYNKAKSQLLYCPYAITSLTIPGTVTDIPDRAFYAYYNLSTLELKSGVKTIGEEAFCYCKNLKNVTLPDTITTVGKYAFAGCGFNEITIPSKSISIYTHAFGYTSNDSKISGFTIKGYTGSPVQTYASNNSFAFVSIGTTTCEHTYGAPTSWNWSSNHSTCTAVFTCSKCSTTKNVTANVTTSTTDAKCTTTGKKTYTANASLNGTNYTTNYVETINAKGHSWKTPGSSDWTWSGYASATCKFTCSECGTSKNVTANITKSTTEPTCSAEGKTVYTATATVTNNSKTATSTKTQTLDKTSHTYAISGWSWSGYTSATATFKCKNCTATQTASGNSTVTSSKAATCESTGYKVHTVTVNFNGTNYSDNKTETLAKTGHNWNSPSYSWSKDKKTCTAKRVCKTNSSHYESETVNTTSIVKTPATCSAMGTHTYTAVFNNSAFAKQTTDYQDIPATGHSWEFTGFTWTGYTKASANFKCSKCQGTTSVQANSEVTSSKAAACDTSGYNVYTVKATFDGKQYTDSRTETIAAKGHNWGAPTYEWLPNSSESKYDCKATRVCRNDNSHTETVTAVSVTSQVVTPATETSWGTRKYTAVFKDSTTYPTQYKEEAIPPKNHNHNYSTTPTGWNWHADSKQATASAYFKCTGCSESVVVNATVTSEISVQPTCVKEGKKVYTATVTYNGNTFTDKMSVALSAKGHNYTVKEWVWDGVKTATAIIVCKNDSSESFKRSTSTISVKTTPATCEKAGTKVYTAKVSFDGKTFTGTKKVTVKALGHDWKASIWTWAKDNKSCTVKFVCANDKTHTTTKKTTNITVKTTAATCTTAGKKVYTAKITLNGKTYTNSKTVTLKAKGHSWNASTWTWAKDNKSCTVKFVCANNKSHTKTVKTTKITVKTTAATCTKAGKKVYTAKATLNGKTYTKTKTVTIKALGHKFSAWKTTSFNVDKKTAAQTRKCTRGDKTEKRTLKNAIVRFAGSNRAETAALISNAGKSGMYKTASTVILATGFDFHDALAAVPLASAYNAPLLLADRDNLSDKTIAEIKRLKAKTVIVVATTTAKDQNGNKAAIGDNVYKQLKALKVTTVKLTGKTYYETAKKVADRLKAKTKKAPTSVFITTNKNYADALSASPVAAALKAPILYVDPKAKLNSVTKKYLTSIKSSVKKVYIAGGVNAVSKNVEKEVLSALGKKSATRFAGGNRYETCVKINKTFAKTLTGKSLCIAKGYNFPDALAGGVFAAKIKAPLFLADKLDAKATISKTQSSYLKSKNPSKLYIFGGETAVPTQLVKTIAKASV